MPLHIAIDARRLGDFGIGTYIRNLVRSLARLDKVNRYTLIVRSNTEELAGLGPNFSTAEYAPSDTEVLQNAAFPFFLRRFSADLYHIPFNSIPYWMPRPYVVTIHDMSTLVFPARSDVRAAMHAERYRRGAVRAARIIAVSHSTRRNIESTLHIPTERIRTIYSAPDPAFGSGQVDPAGDEQILQRYSIRPPFILYAGSVRPQKNVGRLVEAFAVIRAELETHPRYRDLRLVIIGDELSKYPALRRAVIASRVESFVRFLGFVPIDTLKVFYRAAELFAFPSLYEGFGLAPLEAMACGTPVVASDLPALVEAVGESAELVIPDNVFDVARGLRAVLLDDNRRRELTELGRTQALRFNWDHTTRAVLDVYREINSK